MNSSKKRCICILMIICILLLTAGGATAVIDPFFHYHGPLPFLQYPINNQRYQNYGIVKHFSYDAILTGTSMTENFKASEFDELFGVHSVKTPINGSSFKEINDLLLTAVDVNPDLRLVIRGLDGWNLFDHKDHMRTDATYPTYLYDDDLFNDVSYLLNKEILCSYTLEVLKHTIKGNATTGFDEYSWWDTSRTGMEQVKSNYSRSEEKSANKPITPEEIQNIRDTLEQNVIAIARDNPDIQFYYFFTPYSILYMDYIDRYGTLQREMEGYLLATEMLLEYENIHLFTFFDDYALITDLDNYTDIAHYAAHVNAQLLQCMHSGEYQLTRENYRSRWQEIADYYLTYDYDALYS